MWIIASIPFWAMAISVFICGVLSIAMSFDGQFLKKHDISDVVANGYCCFGFMCLPASGCFALIAAKIAS